MTDPITTTYNAKSFDCPTTAAATSPPASIMDEENKNATRTDTLLMGDDDEEEFLWSEPPTTSSSSSTNGLKKTAINLKNTIGKFVSAGMESFHHSGNTTTAERSDDELVPLPTEDMAIDNTQGPISKNNHNDHGDDRLKRLSSEDVRNFNAEIMPSKLIMVRHGQSEGNVNELLYATTPDNAMRLTQLGWEMARMAGKALRKQLPQGETVHFVVSPYARTVETFHGIASAWCDPEEFNHIPSRNKRLKAWYSKLMEMGLTWHEDPRIREQDFGNYQDPEIIKRCKSERHKFGSFYYRMPHGESASDVVS